MRFLPAKARLFGAAILAAALVVFGSFVPQAARPAYALTNCTVSDLAIDGQEQAFLGLINQYRALSGKGSLTISVNLNRAASWHAIDMATKKYFSHTDSLGRSPSTRAMNCGSPQGVGENIAAGTVKDTAQEAFDMWKASSGHNQNMLNGSYKQIGIARYYNANAPYGWYWVTDFSLTNDGTNALTGGGGGAILPTAIPLPAATPTSVPAASPSKAVMLSPLPGSTLHGSTVAFSWKAGSGALEYWLYLGTSQGSNSLYSRGQGTSLGVTVGSLPTDGRTIYARLWTRLAGGWQFTDYTYRSGP